MAGMSVTFLISSYWWKKRGFQFHSTVQTLRLHVTLNALLTSLVTWATQPSVCLKPFKTPTINNTALNHWLQIIEQGKSKTSAFYHTESRLGKDHFFGVFLQVSATNRFVGEPCISLWTHRRKSCVTTRCLCWYEYHEKVQSGISELL